jgi:hypothetical protein
MDHRIEQLVMEAAGGPKDRAELPEGISPFTSTDLLTKVPNFFSFDYAGQPHPGKRYWLRVDNKYWIERYPDGMESKFKTLGRTIVRGNSGTVAVKIEGDLQKTLTENDGGFQVFIPDKGCQDMAIFIRHLGTADSEWRNMSGIENVD